MKASVFFVVLSAAYVASVLGCSARNEEPRQAESRETEDRESESERVSSVQALFQELASEETSDERRDALVTQLSSMTFDEVGVLAVKTMCSREILVHYGASQPEKPWLDENRSENDKIVFAAAAIWYTVLPKAESSSLPKRLAELSLTGSEAERLTYLNAMLFRYLDTDAQAILKQIAEDRTAPPLVSIEAATILIKGADANQFVPLLIRACERIDDKMARSQHLLWGTNFSDAQRAALTLENRKMLVNFGFAEMEKIDDGESGMGYFLAIYLGKMLGVAPIRDVQHPFQPDQRLPEYQGEHGLESKFFQHTVDNARRWWRENGESFNMRSN